MRDQFDALRRGVGEIMPQVCSCVWAKDKVFQGSNMENATALLLGRMPTFSFGEDHLIVKYSERMVAQYLLEVSVQTDVHLRLNLLCPNCRTGKAGGI